jgi:hypothetical protein
MLRSNPEYEAEGIEGSGHKHTLKELSLVTFSKEEVDLFTFQGKQYPHTQ